ncbi:MAG: phosphoglycerate kinase [Hyphomicrobiaceae bacterium]|nr:MAG: phosphoglycerate kinase [Hyphomicrobiaceae bacterium]
MSKLRTLDQAEISGKRVLVRVDLNVPMENGRVTDTTRIARVLPTIREITQRGGKAILLSHFGRPKGRDEKDSLRPLVKEVGEGLGRRVLFFDDCIGAGARKAIAGLGNGEVLVLENTRFHTGEERNDAAFVHELAANGDIYVNDAFSAAHRAHASTEGLARVMPAFAGRAMQAEIESLLAALESPQRPVTAVVGGAKISTKLPILSNLIGKVNNLIVGGAMANTFLLAWGIDVGRSLVEPDLVCVARDISKAAAQRGCDIVLPVDVVCAARIERDVATTCCEVTRVPPYQMILDIGPKTVELFRGLLAGSRTLLWNGPLGAFETPPFDSGTSAVARTAGELCAAHRLTAVAGGGDTVAALSVAGAADRFTYVSTAGGAFLEWLEGKTLPGVAALMNRQDADARAP